MNRPSGTVRKEVYTEEINQLIAINDGVFIKMNSATCIVRALKSNFANNDINQ
jgi:hypothetical protein